MSIYERLTENLKVTDRTLRRSIQKAYNRLESISPDRATTRSFPGATEPDTITQWIAQTEIPPNYNLTFPHVNIKKLVSERNKFINGHALVQLEPTSQELSITAGGIVPNPTRRQMKEFKTAFETALNQLQQNRR